MARLLCVSTVTATTVVLLFFAVALEYVGGSWVSGGRRGGPLWTAEAGLEVIQPKSPCYMYVLQTNIQTVCGGGNKHKSFVRQSYTPRTLYIHVLVLQVSIVPLSPLCMYDHDGTALLVR